MVQVFGNRIIGGIGAPGGGMADAYAGGVNTALNQRTSRQAMAAEGQRMRMLEQQFAWQGEDREEAKRRAAAAEAASAAARARSARIAEERMRIMGGVGGIPAGLTLPTGGRAAPGQTRFPNGAAPAPAPTRGRATSPPLTFGGASAPVARSSSSGGASGEITNIEFLQGTTSAVAPMPGAQGFEQRAGLQARAAAPMTYDEIVAAARAGILPTYDTLIAATEAGLLSGQQAADVNSMIELGVIPSESEQRQSNMPGVTETTPGVPYSIRSGAVSDFVAGVTGRTIGEQAAIDAERARLAGATAPVSAAGATATLPGMVSPEVAATLPSGERAMLSMVPTPTTITDENGELVSVTPGSPDAVAQEQLSFGPRLGAAPQTQEAVMVDLFVSQMGVDPYAPAPPAPPPMREPGAPNDAVVKLLSKREQQVQLIELYTKEGLYGEAEAAYLELAYTDAQLEAAAARLALQEATLFNSPQRLGVVWSTIYNREVEFRPTAQGGFDMIVDGELIRANMDPATLERETLMMSDAGFAAQQAELAMKTAEAYAAASGQGRAEVEKQEQLAGIDVQKQKLLMEVAIDQDMGTKMNDLQKQQLEFILQQQGKLPPEPRKYEYIENDDGSVAIYDGTKLVAYFVRGETVNTAGGRVPTLREVGE
jgi:hypothetical protein